MHSIPPNIIDEVLHRVNLSELVAEYTDVKRSGKGFISCCPFHDDKTPSFSISDDPGLYNCFGCGKKGNTFDFVIEKKGFTFPEAVRYLAKLVGVNIPDSNNELSREAILQTKHRKKIMRLVTQGVTDVYHQCLKEASKENLVWEYIKKRNISQETIDLFQIGVAPPIWEYLEVRLLDKLTQYDYLKEFSTKDRLVEFLLALGLIKKNKSAQTIRYYDTFRNRLVFPITRSDGVVIAFGGRVIVENEPGPKYINSSESLIYTKGQTFYGLSQAINTIRREKHVYLVEGYMDVISMHQFASQWGDLPTGSGKASIATCGTAVTPAHVRILKRLTEKVTVLFDGDPAGLKAAANCFEMFLNSGLEVRAIVLPQDHDPDSLLSKASFSSGEISRVQEIFKSNIRPVFEVFLDFVLSEIKVNTLQPSPVDMGKIAKRVARVVNQTKNPVERELLIRQAVDRLGISFSAFQGLVNQQNETVANTKTKFPQLNDRSSSSNNMKKLQTLSHRLGFLSRHLVVSLLCNPNLATSISQSALFSAEENQQGIIPDNVRQLVLYLAENEFNGLAVSGMDLQTEAETLKGVLNRFGLQSLGLFEEAVGMAKMEGAPYLKVVEEILQSSPKIKLRKEVKIIRNQESQTKSPEELIQLAQEKLLKRRGLEGR